MLRAIDAQDVRRTLWSSEQVSAWDRLGLFAKYVPPTIADGKVFAATYGDAEPLRLYGGDARPQVAPAHWPCPWLSLVIDVATRCVVGLYVTLTGRALTPWRGRRHGGGPQAE